MKIGFKPVRQVITDRWERYKLFLHDKCRHAVILDLFNAVPNLYMSSEKSKHRLIIIQGLNSRDWLGPFGLVGSHLHVLPVWLSFSFWACWGCICLTWKCKLRFNKNSRISTSASCLSKLRFGHVCLSLGKGVNYYLLRQSALSLNKSFS